MINFKVMSACVVEEGREEGGGACAVDMSNDSGDDMPQPPRREVLLSARGRRACSEQGPHPSLGYLRKYWISRPTL